MNELNEIISSFSNPKAGPILAKRILCLERPATLRELGEELDLTRERIRQFDGAIQRRLFNKRRHLSKELSAIVSQLSTDIGDGVILEEVPWLLQKAGVNDDAAAFSVSTMLLLYLSGPYQIWNDLLVQVASAKKIESLLQKFWKCLKSSALNIDQADVLAEKSGIHSPDVVNSVLAELQRRYSHIYSLPDGTYIYCPHAIDRAAMYLESEGSPMNIDSLAELCGVSTGGLLNAIAIDNRLVCVDLRTYGLRSWELMEYEGIVGSIHQALRDSGGRAPLYDVADWVTEHFNVSWSSVVTYATTHHGFIIEDGTLRARKIHEQVRGKTEKDLGTAGGCLVIEGHAALRVVIDPQLWRGSGRPIPRAWALQAGISPGERTLLGGILAISWIGNEPTLGSMRSLAHRDGWPEHGLGFIILGDDGIMTVTRPLPPAPSTDATIIAGAMGSLFALSHDTDGHPLSGGFWSALGERLALEATQRVPGVILARLASRRDKLVTPYVDAFRNALLIAEANGLEVQIDS